MELLIFFVGIHASFVFFLYRFIRSSFIFCRLFLGVANPLKAHKDFDYLPST